MGISTRGLWTKALVDAYLGATVSSARPQEHNIGGNTGSAGQHKGKGTTLLPVFTRRG